MKRTFEDDIDISEDVIRLKTEMLQARKRS